MRTSHLRGVANSTSRLCSGIQQRTFLTAEPKEPHVVTAIPGPKSIDYVKRLSKVQNASVVQFVGDYSKSNGNYIVDIDGNTMLDVFCQISSIPIGYNHKAMIDALQNNLENLKTIVNRPAIASFPGADYLPRLERTLLAVAPKGMNHVQTLMCGACSNENGMKQIFQDYMRKQRGGAPVTEHEMETAMINQAPGCPPLSVLSFHGGFHGRSFGCLATTHTKSIHKLDFPSFDWPICTYPYYENLEDDTTNRKVDDQALAEVQDKMEKFSKKSPVAALIVEPIQSEGGDNISSKYFMQNLQKLCKQNGVGLIMDEVQTGAGPTGTFWYHEQLDLPETPDVVTFSKKMLTGGYYYRDDLHFQEGYRIYNTWMGDPSKLVLLEASLSVMKEQNLLENVRKTGAKLLGELRSLQNEYSTTLSRARGIGTFCSIDCASGALREKVVSNLRNKGINIGVCGDRTIRFRPALVFQEHHVNILMDRFRKTMAEV